MDVVLAIACFTAGTLIAELSLLRLAGVLAIVAAAAAFLLSRRYIPRGIRADESSITYLAFVDKRMPRSDLAVILRAQAWVPSRAGGSWEKSYVFASRDGKVAFSCPAVWLLDDPMSQFAAKLEVPIRGDFTVRVKDRLDPASS